METPPGSDALCIRGLLLGFLEWWKGQSYGLSRHISVVLDGSRSGAASE